MIEKMGPENRSRFDFLVTPGPLVITRSLVEGFPSELTAGKLSCWNITLRDAPWILMKSDEVEVGIVGIVV